MQQPKKILLIDEPHPHFFDRMKDLGFECLLHYNSSREEIIKLLVECQGVLVRSRMQIDQEFLDAGRHLDFVARYGVGTEHIKLDYAAQMEIPVFTSPEGSMDTVAEHAIGMLLMLMNKLAKANYEVKNNTWLREPNRGLEIKGKTIGVLGYGNMGTAFAQRLQGFQAKVITYDKFKSNYGDEYAQEVNLETLQKESDIISIHIPYMPENRHFVDQSFLEKCIKQPFIINTARGTVLNTEDLVDGLKKGKVRGAALDVLEYEEMSFSKLSLANLPAAFQYLKQADNVVLSPHIAGWSIESKFGHAKVLADKIEALYSTNGQLPIGN